MKERYEMIRAMETIIRNLNDERYIDKWLSLGIADGDITEDSTDEDLEWYADTRNFSELMNLFCEIMKNATKGSNQNGVLYCDGVIS